MTSTLSPDQIDIISKTRDACQGRTAISMLQQITLAERQVKGPSWVSRQTFFAITVGRNTISQIIYNAIAALGLGSEKVEKIPVRDVDVRWTGYRAGVSSDQPEPPADVSEKERYNCMIKEVKHPITILYFIGGGFYMNVPSRYHSTTSKLAELTGGRCLSFRYRLSPQHTFPAALLDALFAYLSLLYPDPSHFHEPVSASSIVFAGDSAGAKLALSLIQVILSANSRGEKVQLNNEQKNLPLPAGVALLSAGPDATYAIATKENAVFDIFDGTWSFLKPDFPSCQVWPSNPPRGHIYCDTSLLCHPLVSPCIAKSWKGAPPMWLAGGQEVMAGSVRLLAQVIAQEGGSVVYEEYAEMPHDFAIMSENWPWATTQDWPQSIRCIDHWAKACLRLYKRAEIKSTAVFVETNGEEKQLSLEMLSGVSWEQANERMKEKIEGWEDWTGTMGRGV